MCEPAPVSPSSSRLALRPLRSAQEAKPVPTRSPGWRLTPGVRLLWRPDGSLQLESADRAVIVSGLPRAVATQFARAAAGAGCTRLPDQLDAAAFARLAELGLAQPTCPACASGRSGCDTEWPPAANLPGRYVAAAGQARLSADHTAAAQRRRLPPAQLVADRKVARVLIYGVTRTSALIGALLAASGVGHVGFASSGVVRLRDTVPGGLTVHDEGKRFATAAVEAVRRAAPEADVSIGQTDAEPDLVVLCTDAPVEPDLRDLLHRRAWVHLLVHLDAQRAELGPLVIPGVTACTRCLDLHRLDRDPAWTLLAVQLLTGARAEPAPEPALAASLAAATCSTVLGYLDGEPEPGWSTAADSSWELRAAWPSLRRRTRTPHLDCDCQAGTSRPGRARRPAHPAQWRR